MKNKKLSVPDPQAKPAEEAKRENSGEQAAATRSSQGNEPIPSEQGLPADLATAYQKLQAEKGALYDRLLRKQAELENSRKRVQREKEDFRQHATSELVRALLPVLDGFERGLKHYDSNLSDQFCQGIELIYRELWEVLRRAGLTPVETEGKLFDPHVHQAVETVEAPGHRDQEIVEELQRGYKLRERLLRPAVVKVAVKSLPENVRTTSGQAS